MHTGTLRKLALALTFWLAVHHAKLQAQILGPYGSSPNVFEVDSHGLLSSTGTFGTGSLSLSGAGTRMFWYPGKAAFRAGLVYDNEWNDSNIGPYSAAFGWDTLATGGASMAVGSSTTASGWNSMAVGGCTVASGDYSTAYGRGNWAEGYCSTASGYYSDAMGWASTASGQYNVASADDAAVFGCYNVASGYYSAAFGLYDNADSCNSFVIGMYNLGLSSTGAAASPYNWVETDPLFEIGNGTGTKPADAFVVYKNGNAKLQGTLTTASVIVTVPTGDIPMYTGN